MAARKFTSTGLIAVEPPQPDGRRTDSISLAFEHTYAQSDAGTVSIAATDAAPYNLVIPSITAVRLLYLRALSGGTVKVLITSAAGTQQALRVSDELLLHAPNSGDEMLAIKLVGTVDVEYVVAGDTATAATPLAPVAADWDPTLVRYFLLDYDSGNDSNVGYIDAAAGATLAPTGKAIKTFEQLRLIMPHFGNGRTCAVLIKPRAVGATYRNKADNADDDADFSAYFGYGYLGVHGSTDLTNSTADKLKLGAMQALAGPDTGADGAGAWTIAAGATSSVFAIASGSLGTADSLMGFRVRFEGNVTAALANTSVGINRHDGTTITTMQNTVATPATGDRVYIERPGVRVGRYRGPYAYGLNALSTTVPGNSCQVAGIAATGAVTTGVWITGGGGGTEKTAFCEIVTTSTSAGMFPGAGTGRTLQFTTSYRDETDTARSVGIGIRSGVAFSFNVGGVATLQLQASAILLPAASSANFLAATQFLSIDTGSIIKGGLRLASPGTPAPIFFGTTGMLVGNTSASTTRHVRIIGPALTAGIVSQSTSGRLWGIEFESMGALPCISVDGIGVTLRIEDVSNGAAGGNSDVGLDLLNAWGAQIVTGQSVLPTVTGAVGDIRFAGSVIGTWSGLAITNVRDSQGNGITATAVIVNQCLKVNNQSGGLLAVGDAVRATGMSGGFVTKTLATTQLGAELHGIMVTSPTNGADGYMAPAAGFAKVNLDLVPTNTGVLYTSPLAAGLLTRVAPTNPNFRLPVGFLVNFVATQGTAMLSPDKIAT